MPARPLRSIRNDEPSPAAVLRKKRAYDSTVPRPSVVCRQMYDALRVPWTGTRSTTNGGRRTLMSRLGGGVGRQVRRRLGVRGNVGSGGVGAAGGGGEEPPQKRHAGGEAGGGRPPLQEGGQGRGGGRGEE